MVHQRDVVGVIATDFREAVGEFLPLGEELFEAREAAIHRRTARIDNLRVGQDEVDEADMPEIVRHLVAIVIIYAARVAAMQFWQTENLDASDPKDFTLEVYGEPGGIEFEEGANPPLPLYEPETGQWSLGGNRIDDFAPLVQGLKVGPHGSSPFVIVDLPESATVDVYRKAIASLASHGICRVGIFSPTPAENLLPTYENHDWPPKGFVAVFRVLSVKFDTGTSHECTDRFPAWAPWAMYRE